MLNKLKQFINHIKNFHPEVHTGAEEISSVQVDNPNRIIHHEMTITSTVKSSEEIKDEIFSIIERQLDESHEDMRHVKVTALSGPFMRCVKIQNNQSLRTYRIEIPKHTTKDCVITIFKLERTNNVVKDVDSFYNGPAEEISVHELYKRVHAGVFADGWISEHIDRSHDISTAHAVMMESVNELPKEDNQLSCAVIETVQIQQTNDGVILAKMKFKGLEGLKVVEIAEWETRSYRPQSVFVINSEGGYGVWKFNKVMKYAHFGQDDWKKIRSYFTTRSTDRSYA